MATTEADNKEMASRIAEEAWGEGNLEVIDEYLADDFVSHNPALPEDVHGPEGYKETIRMFRSAFPDLSLTIEDRIADGNEVVLRLSQSGTHKGVLMGIEPTGQRVETTGIVIGRVENGKAAEEWAYLDRLGMMQQLGVVESPTE